MTFNFDTPLMTVCYLWDKTANLYTTTSHSVIQAGKDLTLSNKREQVKQQVLPVLDKNYQTKKGGINT